MRSVLSALAILVVGLAPSASADGVSTDFVDRLVAQAENLRPEILELAFAAYAEGLEDGHFTRERLTIIDYSLPSYEKRLWVVDMETQSVIFEEIVSHGMGSPRGSGGDMETAKDFSNLHGSKKSSLGLFITAETYQGRHGYTLRLDGLENGVNGGSIVAALGGRTGKQQKRPATADEIVHPSKRFLGQCPCRVDHNQDIGPVQIRFAQ